MAGFQRPASRSIDSADTNSNNRPSPPDRGHSVLRLFVDFFSARMGAAILSLATILIVTHETPVEVAGIYIAALAYATLLFNFLDLGTGPALVREAALGDMELRITVFVWTRAMVTLGVVALGGAGLWLAFPPDARLAGGLALLFVASSMYTVVGPIGQVVGSAQRFRNLTLTQGVVVLCVIVGVVLIVHNPGADLLVGAYSVGAILSTVRAAVWVKPYMCPLPLRTIAREVRANVRRMAALGLATGAGSIYQRVDQSIVLQCLGPASSAYYGLASRINAQARLLPATMQLAISAFLARQLRAEGGLSATHTRLLTRLVVGIGLGLAFVIISTSDLVVLILGGPKYSPAVDATLVLGVAIVATCFNYVVATSAVMGARDRMYLTVTVTVALFNIGANLWVTPRFGVTATACVAAATEILAVASISAKLSSRSGGLSISTMMVTVGAAAAAAFAKHCAMAAGTGIEVAVSVLLFALSGPSLFVAYRAFKTLSALAGSDDHRTDVVPSSTQNGALPGAAPADSAPAVS